MAYEVYNAKNGAFADYITCEKNNPRTGYVVDLNSINESEDLKAVYEDAEDCMRMQAFLNG